MFTLCEIIRKFFASENSLLLKQLSLNNLSIFKGEYLLLGDNRASSLDAGEFGLVPKEHIIGKVVEIFK